jgi:SnoaL-like domain
MSSVPMAAGSSSKAAVAVGIQQAIAAYTHALDDGRTDDLVATFCDEGGAEFPSQPPAHGRAALHELYSKVKPQGPQRHVITNIVMTEWNDDRAAAVSDLVFFRRTDAGWVPGLVGRYEDALRCVDGVWRFEYRKLSF